MRWVVAAVVGAGIAAGVACGGEAPSAPSAPQSVTKDGWEEWLGAPAWVVAPPPRAGFAPFVVAGQSNLLHLAHTAGRRAPDFKGAVALRLRPILGADADAIAAKIDAVPTSVRKGFYLERPKRGRENAIGGQTYTAYELWELPIASVVAAVPEASREAATRALERAEPEDAPAWESGESAPAWVDAPKPREGFATVLVGQDCDRADVARVNAMAIGPSWMVNRITTALAPFLDRKSGAEVGVLAETRRVLRARAVVPKGADHVAWTLWDVPLDRLIEKVPEEHRAAARRALEAPLRPAK